MTTCMGITFSSTHTFLLQKNEREREGRGRKGRNINIINSINVMIYFFSLQLKF